MGESAAAQPPPRRRPAAADPAVRLAGPIGRRDVEAVADRACAGITSSEATVVTCDVGAVAGGALPTIDVLARLALVARRHRRWMRLEHASPELLELLELCGLTEVLPCDEPPVDGGSGGEVVG